MINEQFFRLICVSRFKTIKDQRDCNYRQLVKHYPEDDFKRMYNLVKSVGLEESLFPSVVSRLGSLIVQFSASKAETSAERLEQSLKSASTSD